MKISWGVLSVLTLPLCLGMLSAFLTAKRRDNRAEEFKAHSMSDSLWYGYSVGNFVCILSSLLFAIILLITYRVSFGPAIASLIVIAIFISLVSMISGLILYLPCALFGYNLASRKRAEAEIARTQQQILEDIQTEKSV
ncbi:MAG: hypothetical protein ACJAR1_001948 [Rubritalea sp.]|jgi:hypothetical protein